VRESKLDNYINIIYYQKIKGVKTCIYNYKLM